MAAKEVKFGSDAREKMLRGVDTLAIVGGDGSVGGTTNGIVYEEFTLIGDGYAPGGSGWIFEVW